MNVKRQHSEMTYCLQHHEANILKMEAINS